MCGRGNLPESSFSTSRQESRARIAHWGTFRGDDVLDVIRARGDCHRSFEYSYIGTLLDIMNSTCALGIERPYRHQVSEIYAARARYLRWRGGKQLQALRPREGPGRRG